MFETLSLVGASGREQRFFFKQKSRRAGLVIDRIYAADKTVYIVITRLAQGMSERLSVSKDFERWFLNGRKVQVKGKGDLIFEIGTVYTF